MVDQSIRLRYAAVAMCLAMLLAACTGGVHGSGSSGTPSAPQYTVGGTVSGLSGSGLVLASNTGETLNVSGNGSFTFKTTYPAGTLYYVLVLQQPGTPTQTCVATNGSGTIGNSSVSGITVTCQDKTAMTDTIGGVVVGLTGAGLVLQNGSDTIAVAANGNFTFPTAPPGGTQYNVSVLSPPINPYEDCAVLNGQGITAQADIVNIAIVCTVNSSPTHTIGGTVTGVSGTLVLEDNGRDDLTITADGPFKFPLPIPSGSSYDVRTKSAAGTQSQSCTFVNATGMVGDSDVTNVTISCTANVGIKATVSGLAGTGLVLQNTSDGDSLAVAANGTVAFPSGISPGEAYNVTVTSQPSDPTQNCVVSNGAGTVPETTLVTVTCTTNTYTVGGVVTGLPDPGSQNTPSALPLILQDSTGATISIPATSVSPFSFTFPALIPSGSTYTISVQQQPGVTGFSGGAQTSTVCTVSGGTGTITNANIANVAVTCIRPAGFAYVTNTADNTISTYVIDSASGALLSSGPPVSTGTAPTGATVGLDRNDNDVLYTSNSGSNNVSGFSVDPNTGNLAPLAGSPFTIGGLSAPTSIAAAGTGIASVDTWLYATNPGAGGPGSISAATIGANGELTDITGTAFATGAGPTSAQYFPGGAIGSGNSFLLETNTSDTTVASFVLNAANGGAPQAPATGPTATTGSAPTSVAGLAISSGLSYFDFAYVASSGDGTLWSYSIDSNTGSLARLQIAGAPAPVPPTLIGAGLSAVAIAGQASSCPCYVFASATAGVYGFSVAANGLLTPLVTGPNGPVASGAGAGPGAIATLGTQYVYVVNTTDQTISAYAIAGPNQALTPITGTVMKTGRGPSSIVVVFRPVFGG
jgi:hypothetical protein